MKSLQDAAKYVSVSVTTFDDVAWSAAHKDLFLSAARQLYSSLGPNCQTTDEEILKTVTEWSFQVLPLAQVEAREESELSLWSKTSHGEASSKQEKPLEMSSLVMMKTDSFKLTHISPFHRPLLRRTTGRVGSLASTCLPGE